MLMFAHEDPNKVNCFLSYYNRQVEWVNTSFCLLLAIRSPIQGLWPHQPKADVHESRPAANHWVAG